MLTTFRSRWLFALSILVIALYALWYTGYLQLYAAIVYNYISPIEIPERPANVPESAFWMGDRDKSWWVDFEAIPGSDSCLICRRYNSNTGELLPQGWWQNRVFCLDSGKIGIDTLRHIGGLAYPTLVRLWDGRTLHPDLSVIADRLSRVEPGMTMEQVRALGVHLRDFHREDSTHRIWEVDVPWFITEPIKCIFDRKTDRLVKVKWGSHVTKIGDDDSK